jgi:hypothetical protein
VVDAQRPGVAHLLPQRGRVRRVSGPHEASRNPWRQAPLLAFQIEIVGGTADAGGKRVQAGLYPGFRPARTDADGEILEETERKPRCARASRHFGQLKVCLPLQVEEVFDSLAMDAGKIRHRRGARIAVLGGPGRPAPYGRVVA